MWDKAEDSQMLLVNVGGMKRGCVRDGSRGTREAQGPSPLEKFERPQQVVT